MISGVESEWGSSGDELPASQGGKGQGKNTGHRRKSLGNPYLITRDVTQVCFTWNRDRNGCKAGPCPNGRAHVCEKCLQPHRGIECSNGVGGAKPHT